MRKTRARGLLIAGVIVALVGLGFVLGRTMVRRKASGVAPELDLAPDVSQRIRDFRRVKIKDGRKVWELVAQEAEYFVDQDHVLVESPEVSFFSEDGQNIAVKGREGKVFLSGNTIEKIELGGGIEVKVGDYVVRTEEAVYVQDKDAIVSAGPISISGSEMELEGRGLLVELGRQRVALLHGVRTTLRGRPGANLDVLGSATSRSPQAPAASRGRPEEPSATQP